MTEEQRKEGTHIDAGRIKTPWFPQGLRLGLRAMSRSCRGTRKLLGNEQRLVCLISKLSLLIV